MVSQGLSTIHLDTSINILPELIPNSSTEAVIHSTVAINRNPNLMRITNNYHIDTVADKASNPTIRFQASVYLVSERGLWKIRRIVIKDFL